MRKIEKIIIHCSATPPHMDIGVSEIDAWHKQRGFKGCGYHYVIRKNGEIERGREDAEIGAHVKGYNARSIGICLVGGLDKNNKAKDTRTKEQTESLKALVFRLLSTYEGAEVLGHRDLNKNKECPCFDVKEWFGGI